MTPPISWARWTSLFSNDHGLDRLRLWAAWQLPGIVILIASKHRILLRAGVWSPDLLTTFTASSMDVAAFSAVSALGVILPGTPAFLVTVATFSVVLLSQLFLSKMHQPLTWDLLQQIGGLTELESSLTAPSSKRGFYLLGAGITVYAGLAYLAGRARRTRGAAVVVLSVTVSLAAGMRCVSIPFDLRDLSQNLISSAFFRAPAYDAFATDPMFASRPSSPIPITNTTPSPSVKYNVLLIQLESVRQNILDDEEAFATLMPNLYARRGMFQQYANHYAPWPLTAKATFSIYCGRYPIISPAVEMRLFPDHHCGGWIGAHRDAGFATMVHYSGSLRYDLMGSFFQSQGVDELYDRRDLNASGNYRENSWGMDDMGLADFFDQWLTETAPDRFLALSLTSNSHHPGWAPDSQEDVSPDPYRNAVHSQDAVVGAYLNILERHHLLGQTMVIITSDHGTPGEAEETRKGGLPRGGFRVPLFVYIPGVKPEAPVQYPTSHVELQGSILQWQGLGGRYLERHLLSESVPIFMFFSSAATRFMLLSGEQAYLFRVGDGAVHTAPFWATDASPLCRPGVCAALTDTLWQLMQTSIRDYEDFARPE